jgi:hypothetical protein
MLTNLPHHDVAADVELVAVVEQLDVVEPDRVLALDAQLEHQPVGEVDEIFVEHGQPAQDGRLPVIDPVRVRPGVMHPVGVLPLGGAASAQIPIAGRGQSFAKPLPIRVEPFVGQRESVHRVPLFTWRVAARGSLASVAAGRGDVNRLVQVAPRGF